MAMKNSNLIVLCATLLWAAASLIPVPAFAGSGCDGSAPAALVVPKYSWQLLDVCVDIEKYDGFWNQDGKYISDPPGSNLIQCINLAASSSSRC
jgi:hypothetical protein